ncbi:hypothetical protein HBN65_03750 [Pseudomonas lundensis]|uniref:hypothetical protein n=1 Tax=Pseudomonas lundensis TaxID=86185 RepID=UPI001475CD92|nr:hypothetical protein [Pseudomonas lundensis]NNA05926.1 hypothetical protein [Pseudomonas lundensis]
MSKQEFDKEKLLENAVHSIQLGVHDYQLCSGTEIRALSSARNLFAGMLLIFKYRIASFASTPAEAVALIYKPKSIVPKIGATGIEWIPILESNKTIDFRMIGERLDSLGVKTDWKKVTTLQHCRNALEHLHPNHGIGEIQRFISELFPILRSFIEDELRRSPAELLGDAWQMLLQTHDFYAQAMHVAVNSWKEAGIKPHAFSVLSTCHCPSCGSKLLQPHPIDIQNGKFGKKDFRFQCVKCNYSSILIGLIEDKMYDSDGLRDGPEEDVHCPACHSMRYDGVVCSDCGLTPHMPLCKGCFEPLTIYESEHGRLCDACSYHQMVDEEFEPHIT